MPLFEITPRAAAQILKTAEDGNMTGLPLRIAAKHQADASIQYQLGFDELREGDVHITCEGVDVVFPAPCKELLNGATLDFVELEANDFRFIFLNPNDPHYIPPKDDEHTD